jgi:hypothetical protein
MKRPPCRPERPSLVVLERPSLVILERRSFVALRINSGPGLCLCLSSSSEAKDLAFAFVCRPRAKRRTWPLPLSVVLERSEGLQIDKYERSLPFLIPGPGKRNLPMSLKAK